MDKYTQIKKNYNSGAEWHFQKSFSYDWSKQVNKFVKMLKGKLILDAGCGAPRDISLFLKHNLKIEGIDFSKEAIKKCRMSFPELKFYEGNFNKIPVQNEYYDGIWASASILNTPKKELPVLLKEFLRTLKTGVILYAPEKEGKDEKIVKDQYGERLFSDYTEDEMKKIFKNASLNIKYSETVTNESLTGTKSDKTNWVCIYGEKNYDLSKKTLR